MNKLKRSWHKPMAMLLALLLMLSLSGCNKQKVNSPSFEVITSGGEESATPSDSVANPTDNAATAQIETTEVTTEVATEQTTEETTEAIEPVSINLVAVGDMLLHGGIHNRALQADGTYNYSFVFEHTKDRIQAADIAVANQEVILGGVELGVSSYPTFNSPQSFGDYLVDAGFDVIEHASNHTIDAGATGILNTINYWKNNHPDITYLGINESAKVRQEIPLVEYNGVTIAMLNYTYGLNGFSLPSDQPYLVNLMNEWTKDQIAEDLKKARELADFVIVFPHWGEEYDLYGNSEQATWAQFFADNGADLIIGAHPHVIQPVKWVTASDGRQVLVYYSLGNFISIQYRNYNMLGGFAEVTITKDASGTYISDYDMDFVVTHFTSPNPNRNELTTYFLSDYTQELASRHGILVDPYNTSSAEAYRYFNDQYPFSVEGLWNIVREVCPEFAK